jgi:hypothetical protein
MPAARDLWRRGQQGWPPRFVLVQFPNAPLLVALAASGIGRLTSGEVHDVARVVASVGLGVWALLELLHGVNWLRRLLGAVFLVIVVVGAA